MKKLDLDVGCGFRPTGMVNIDPLDFGKDVFAGEHFFRRDPRSIPNLIVALGEYLPIRDNVFEKAYSKGVIEHTENPSKFLKEMFRVTKDYIKIIVPHRFWQQPKYHIIVFNMKQLEDFLKKMFFGGKISRYELNLSFVGFPHPYFAILRRPFLMTMEIWLHGYGFFRRK